MYKIKVCTAWIKCGKYNVRHRDAKLDCCTLSDLSYILDLLSNVLDPLSNSLDPTTVWSFLGMPRDLINTLSQ